MNVETTLSRIPLQQLQLSPHNARKTASRDAEDLAASIAAIGLLQNLTVLPVSATEPDKPGDYEVIAGGRRLAALKLLAERDELPAELRAGIPCRLITDDTAAIEASAAENTIRERMHPADEFVAFQAMINAGKTLVDVAAHWGVPERVVSQRLKLANVRPELFELYREGEMDLEQLQALALTDNHEMQRQAWFSAKYEYERHPRHLREFITRQEVSTSSAIARFVGIDAYEAAGGGVRRDLFSEEAWLSDAALLDRLAMDKLEAKAEALRGEGWAWVEPHLALDYAKLAEYPAAIKPGESGDRWASDADAKRAAELEARIRELENRAEEDDSDQDEYQAAVDEYEDLVERRVVEVPEEIRNVTGVLLSIHHDGSLRAEHGRLKPGQRIDHKSGAVSGQAKATAGGEPAKKPKKPQLSADMERRLALHRAAACRQLLIEQPALAVQLLVADMVAQVLDRGAHLFDVRVKNVHRDTHESKFPELAKADARKCLGDSIKSIIPTMKQADILPWVQKLNAEQLQQVIALVAAVSLENLRDRSLSTIAEQLGCNMADWWTADPETYLGNVPKVLILEAVTEARGKDVAATLESLKRDALIAEAAKHLAGTGWLPKPLRGAGYALKGAEKTKAPVAKKVTGKAAKKPAKKASKKATKTGAAKKPAKK